MSLFVFTLIKILLTTLDIVDLICRLLTFVVFEFFFKFLLICHSSFVGRVRKQDLTFWAGIITVIVSSNIYILRENSVFIDKLNYKFLTDLYFSG